MELERTLIDKSNEIDKEVLLSIKSDIPNLLPLTDGIINILKYEKSKYKILWVLKEPYYDELVNGKPTGGGWDLKKAYNDKNNSIKDFHRKTFDRMIFVSYGILNRFCTWNETVSKINEPEIIEAFKSTAYINVKKMQGYNTSTNKEIEAAYITDKSILLKQLNYYDPDIIIFGSTFYLFMEDLKIKASELNNSGKFQYAIKNNKAYIDAYHPAYWCYSKEKYYEDILPIAKQIIK